MNFAGVKQVKCTMTRHVAPPKEVNKLFDGLTLTVDTECERCHAPIILERENLKDRSHYYITEYIEVED